MEPKILNEFISEKSFWISDARDSDLVLRSPGGMFNPINIDILFRAVLYMELPFSLTGIRITQPCDKKAIELEAKFGNLRSVADSFLGELVYVIESEGERYHIVASGAYVHINTLPSDRLPLWFYADNGPMDEDEYFQTYGEEYFKIERTAHPGLA